MKFLIVDDEIDICDFIELLILEEFEVETVKVLNGEEALKAIHEQGPFDVVITDYRMPKKNGFELYKEVRAMGSNVPFLVCSAEMKQINSLFGTASNVQFAPKPFFDNELIDHLLKLLIDKKPPEQTKSYLPVSLEVLRRVETPAVNLYIRLNDHQYVKVLKEHAIFDQNEFDRFKKKNITHLAIETLDYKAFFQQFRKNVFTKSAWVNADTKEVMPILEEDWSLILQANQVFGWSESLITFAKENIAKTLALAKTNPQLKKIFEKLSFRENKSYLIPHSYANVFLTTRILQELGWNSESTIQKITFASMFHDLDLNETMFRNKLDLLRAGPLSLSIQQPTNYQIYHHATKGAQLMQRWSSCPPDVDRIIAQHHEQFDGSGFPNKLNFQTITPLSGVFIIAEDMIYQKINFPESSLGDYIQNKESLYNKGDMKPVYQASLKVAQEIDSSTK